MQEYQPPEGPAWARAAGRRWIALNGFEPSVDDIVVTSGAQHALLAVISSLIEPGDVVVSDRLTYYGLKALAQMFRFRIVGIGSDEEGMSADELDEVCRRETVQGRLHCALDAQSERRHDERGAPARAGRRRRAA